MDSDRGTHQASKGYPWLPKMMVQEGLDQILTSSGFWVSLEDESSWMCLAMPFSSCQGEMQEDTWRLCVCSSLPMPNSTLSPSQEHCGLQDTSGETALGQVRAKGASVAGGHLGSQGLHHIPDLVVQAGHGAVELVVQSVLDLLGLDDAPRALLQLGPGQLGWQLQHQQPQLLDVVHHDAELGEVGLLQGLHPLEQPTSPSPRQSPSLFPFPSHIPIPSPISSLIFILTYVPIPILLPLLT